MTSAADPAVPADDPPLRYEIRRLPVWPAARIVALVMAAASALSSLLALPFLDAAPIGSLLSGPAAWSAALAGSLATGLASGLLVALLTGLYNLIAPRVGGIVLELTPQV